MSKGIASWGCISGAEQMNIDGTNVIYAKGRSNETSLEPNHTQFIFIDGESGGEFVFRSRFEKAMAGESLPLHNNHRDSISGKEKHFQRKSIVFV